MGIGKILSVAVKVKDEQSEKFMATVKMEDRYTCF